MNLRTGITDISFTANGNTGYAVDADRILKTINRGITWSISAYYLGSYLSSVKIVDENNIYAFSTDFNTSQLIKTNNGGGFWLQVTLPAEQKINDAFFLTSTKGWVNTRDNSGGDQTFYTSNAGASWVLKNNREITPFSSYKMKFINDSTGFALTDLFYIYKTTDSGKIWERIPRNNQFEYLNYHHNDLQIWNDTQFWAGGGQGFLELTTNGGGTVIPSSYFRIDTSGIIQSGSVKLTNYSKPGYQFQWAVNNVPISHSYQATYTHDINSLTDSVQLIVSNGVFQDTLIQYQHFYPPVIITSFSPVSAGSADTIVIRGNNLSGAQSVSFGNRQGFFKVISDSVIVATVGSGSSGSVKVITLTGSGSLAGFTFIPPPVISSFTPTSAKAGTTITITGQNFNNVTAVNFGSVAATSFKVISPTVLTAVLAEGNSGKISVTATGGTGAIDGFIDLPDILTFTPTSGTFGTYISITGTGFGQTNNVTIGGIKVDSFEVNSFTSIKAVLSNGASGDVIVTTSGGSAAKGNFKYYEPPAIVSFSPTSGPVGSSVTITGNHFDPVFNQNIVYFGAVKGTITGGSSTSLTVKVPAGASFQSLSVTSNNLTTYTQKPFIVTFPNVNSITPNSFANKTELNTGNGFTPVDGLIGDIDGDGKPDLLVINRGAVVNETAISIYRNTSNEGAVSFASKIDFLLPSPGGIALSDIDGDGKFDFVVTDDDRYNLAIYRNVSTQGNISFAPKITIATAQMGGELSIEDLDGDGKPDIVLSSWWENKLVVHRNISNPGNIAFGQRLDISGASERNVIARDMDQDGKPDLIMAGRILKNTSVRGFISFGEQIDFPFISHSYIAVGDINDDGKPDIVCSQPYGSKVVIFKNTTQGKMSFSGPIELNSISTPTTIDISDIDGDGKPDIVTMLENFNFAVFKNTNSIDSISFSDKVDYEPGRFIGSNNLAIGDLNGDGKPDIVLISEMSRAVSIFINDVKPEPFIQSFTPTLGNSGTQITITGENFTGTTSVSFGGTPALSFVINSNTSITAIVANGASGEVSVTNAFGTGICAGFVWGNPPLLISFFPLSAKVGDKITITGKNFNTTTSENIVLFGSVKAIVNSASSTSLTVTVPTGSIYQPLSVSCNNLTAYSDKPFLTTFTGGLPIFSKESFGDTTHFKDYGEMGAIGDLDGDGLLDLALIGSTHETLDQMQISRNTSTGSAISFAPSIVIKLSTNRSSAVSIADVNGDGKPDIIVFHGYGSLISVLINKSTIGNLSFAPAIDFATGLTEGGPCIIKDLDNDGKPEIIVAGYGAGIISVFRNLSTPNKPLFANRIDYFVEGYPKDIKAEDIDGDGKPELLAVGLHLTIFKNTGIPGKISFAPAKDFPVGDWPSSLTVGDIDGDNKPDIVVANTNVRSVSVMKNTSTGSIISFAKNDYGVRSLPWRVWLNDLDGDGKPDLCVQSQPGSPENDITADLFRNSSISGTISFDPPSAIDAGLYSKESFSGDMDGDGKADIVIFASSTGLGSSLLILKNKIGSAVRAPVCQNGIANITSNKTGNSYQWQQNTGNGFTNISNNANFSGATSVMLQIKNVSLSLDGYQYRCKVDNDSTVISVLSVNGLPSANAGADKSICFESAGDTIGSPSGDGNIYSWSPAKGLSSATDSEPVASPSVTTKYILSVTNTAGCMALDSVLISVLQTPAPSIKANGNTSFCTGGSVLLTSSASNGNQWYHDGTIISGATAQTYTAVETGIYTVRNTLNGCLSAFSSGMNISASPVPATPGIITSGPSSFCQGKTVILSTTDTSHIQWYKDGKALAAGQTFIANETGIYTIKSTVNGCTSNASGEISLDVINEIPTPVISQIGSVLNSSANTGNQWYLNGQVINGAVLPDYIFSDNGTYSVNVTINGCRSDSSNAITINNIPGVLVGPNPVHDILSLQFPGNRDILSVTLMDISGHSVIEKATFTSSHIINVKGVQPGTYIVYILNTKTGKSEKKIIIKH